MVYAQTVQLLEREVEGARLAAALITALGGQAEAPSMSEVQHKFDEWLVSEPKPVDTAQAEWRRVMGLGAA